MNMPKINLRDQKVQFMIVMLIVCVGGVYLWGTNVYAKKRNDLVTLNKAKQEKETRLNAIYAMKPQRDKLIEDIAQKRQVLDSLKSIFPDQKEIAKLIQDVTRLSHESRVFTTKFLPLPDSIREYYVENHYSLTMWATYHDFAGFLSKLSNLKLIVNLTKMDLKAHPYLAETRNGIPGRLSSPYSVIATYDLTTFSSKR